VENPFAKTVLLPTFQAGQLAKKLMAGSQTDLLVGMLETRIDLIERFCWRHVQNMLRGFGESRFENPVRC
jgi:hypothetical protein